MMNWLIRTRCSCWASPAPAAAWWPLGLSALAVAPPSSFSGDTDPWLLIRPFAPHGVLAVLVHYPLQLFCGLIVAPAQISGDALAALPLLPPSSRRPTEGAQQQLRARRCRRRRTIPPPAPPPPEPPRGDLASGTVQTGCLDRYPAAPTRACLIGTQFLPSPCSLSCL